MEREAVLVGIDVGTSKVCALIGEVARDGSLTIVGKGVVPAIGLRRGVVVNIDQTVRSIGGAVDHSERLSGYQIDRAFVGVGGQHVESQNSRGAVAVSGHRHEVNREDVNRALEVARAVSIPSNREVLHVLPRGFIVDGQEGVKDPLGMSAIRLEIETHIVTAGATAVRNLAKCVQAANVKIDELVAASLASAECVLSDTERDLGVAVADIGAGTIDLALFLDGSPFKTIVLPVGGNNVTNDLAIGLKTSLEMAEELKIQHGSCDLSTVADDDLISVSILGEAAGRTISRVDIARIIEARMRETFEMLRAEIRAAGDGILPAGRGADRRRRSAGGRGRARSRGHGHARPRGRPDRHRRADGQHHEPGLQHGHRPALLGRQGIGVRRGHALRVGSRLGPAGACQGRPRSSPSVGARTKAHGSATR